MKYFGLFQIISKLGPVAYKLQLLETARIHLIFHISLLKKFKGDTIQLYIPLPLTTTELGLILQPQRVLATRVIKLGSVEIPQVLIEWQSAIE